MMGSYHQFPDIPQIDLTDDSPLNSWPNDFAGPRMVSISGEQLPLDDARVHEMSSMQRFLHGPERPLFTTGFLHSNYNLGATSLNPGWKQYHQYAQPWPSVDCYDHQRDPSPDNSSSYSSQAPQNELRSTFVVDQSSYGNPLGHSQTKLPYQDSEQVNGGSFHQELHLSGGGIDPRNIEFNHNDQAEPSVEEFEATEAKFEYDYEQEHSYAKMDVDGDEYRSCRDSALGHSVRDAESVQPISPSPPRESMPPVELEEEASDSDYKPISPRTRRRRRSSLLSASNNTKSHRRNSAHGRKNSTASNTPSSNRVNKKTRGSNTAGNNNSTNSANNANAARPFPCPLAIYGCQSNFVSKNEWKRHVSTQHIKLGFWRCDLCPTTVDTHDPSSIYHNDFNRKDLFTQHLRRMHAAPIHHSAASRNQKEYPVNEDNLAQHQKRCYQSLRSPPPESACLFCDRTFAGPGSWEERMEHVGRHLEKDRKANGAPVETSEWQEDIVLRDWLIEEGLVEYDRTGTPKLGDGKPKRNSVNDDDDSDA